MSGSRSIRDRVYQGKRRSRSGSVRDRECQVWECHGQGAIGSGSVRARECQAKGVSGTGSVSVAPTPVSDTRGSCLPLSHSITSFLSRWTDSAPSKTGARVDGNDPAALPPRHAVADKASENGGHVQD